MSQCFTREMKKNGNINDKNYVFEVYEKNMPLLINYCYQIF